MSAMTPRRRLEALLRGEGCDRLPFLIWNNKLPEGDLGRAVLEAGACVIVKSHVCQAVGRTICPEEQTQPGPDGYERRRLTYQTPQGPLTTSLLHGRGTTWREEWPFKSERDYDALLALIDDYEYTPCYEQFLADDASYGDSGLARPATEKSPLFELMYEIMGLERFALEWHLRRDRVLEVHEALLAGRRKRLEIVARSPALFAIVDGNIEFSVVGGDRFATYYAPAIREACRTLHERGKLAGLHLDANNRLLAEAVAALPVDIIESLTPPPDCDLSITEARAAWPGKLLMVHFPSSVHLGGPEAVRRTAERLVAEARQAGRVALGAIEDAPRQDTVAVLAECVRDFGAGSHQTGETP